MSTSFFPRLYSDELLYSVMARYHKWNSHKADKQTIRDLFNKSTTSAIFDLPSNLNKLCTNINNEHINPDLLIVNHSMFPVYRPFLSSKMVVMLERDMTSGAGGNIHFRIGAMASSVPMVDTLRFCLTCFQEDTEKYGEAYWHRSHQLHGVDCCHIHGDPLHEVGAVRSNKHTFSAISDDSCKLTSNAIKQWRYSQVIASEVNWLLINMTPILELEEIRKKYISLNQSKGYANHNGIISMNQLEKDFIAFYSIEYLLTLGCPIQTKDNWLNRILRKPRNSFHPIKHILLTHFLGSRLNELFSDKERKLPFGTGPWMCLNAAAEHYQKRVVHSCTITRDYHSGGPVGTFDFECGFIYSRKGPDQASYTDEIRIGRIKAFGEVWEKRLLQLIDIDGNSYRAAAKLLKVDTGTVIKHYQQLKQGIASQKSHVYLPSLQEREQRRSNWISIVQSHPDQNQSEIRRAMPAEFAWLYRNDKEWLCQNSPARLTRRKATDERVDWHRRDALIEQEVMGVIQSELNCSDKPHRLTLSYIGKQIQRLALLEQHLDKLPKTAKTVAKFSETVEDFQVRRISYVVKKLLEEGGHILE